MHQDSRKEHKEDIADIIDLKDTEKKQLKMVNDLQKIISKKLKKDDPIRKELMNKIKELKESCQKQKKKLQQFKKEKRQIVRAHNEAIRSIKNGTAKEKAMETATTTELLREQRATQAEDESAVENKVNQAAHYISDYSPLAYSALTFHATITSSLAEMMVSEECNATYQVAEWMVFLLATIGLVRLVWRANTYRDDTFGIFNAIVSQWAVFLVLLLSTTSFIPLQCYTGSSAWPKWIASALLLVLPFLGFKLSATSQALDSTDNGTPSSRSFVSLTPKSGDEENGPLMDGSDR